ncbi:MAG: hypothetical protein ACYC3I_08620 [Gemmataceae bacterium]
MDRDPMLVALTAELVRARLPEVREDLRSRYTDGGRKSGARREEILETIAEAYALAAEAVKAMEK